MGTLRFFEEVVSFKIRRTFGFADYNHSAMIHAKNNFFIVFALIIQCINPFISSRLQNPGENRIFVTITLK